MWTLDLLHGGACYVDTNALIYAFEGEPGSAVRLRLADLFEQCEAGRVHAMAGLLVRAEVLVRPLRDGNANLVQWYRQLLSGHGLLTILALDAVVADHAALLRAEHAGLRLPDAIHLATAIQAGCDFFLSGDQRLAAAAGQRIRVLDTHQLAAQP